MNERPTRRLVIGLGNRLRRDDGCGLAVARRVLRRAPPDEAILVWEGEPMALLDRWDDAADVVLVDATSPGASPGEVRRFDAIAGPLPSQLFALSSHAIGIAEAIETARALGRLPASLIVYGIEGVDCGLGAGLTPEVARSANRLADRLSTELNAATTPSRAAAAR